MTPAQCQLRNLKSADGSIASWSACGSPLDGSPFYGFVCDISWLLPEAPRLVFGELDLCSFKGNKQSILQLHDTCERSQIQKLSRKPTALAIAGLTSGFHAWASECRFPGS